MPFVYILRCSDGTFCVGHTDNLAARIVAHKAGTGSTYTAPAWSGRPIARAGHSRRVFASGRSLTIALTGHRVPRGACRNNPAPCEVAGLTIPL